MGPEAFDSLMERFWKAQKRHAVRVEEHLREAVSLLQSPEEIWVFFDRTKVTNKHIFELKDGSIVVTFSSEIMVPGKGTPEEA